MERGELELELKFTGAPAQIAALPQSQFVKSLSSQPGRWQRLRSVYYDTPDKTLLAEGISLRMQNGPKGHIQTIKRATLAGAILREQFQTELAAQSDFPALTGDDAIDAMLAQTRLPLVPVASIEIDHWIQKIDVEDTQLELAIDMGRAGSSKTGVAAPIAEMEIEFLSGEMAGLFKFAHMVAENTELRLSAESKLGIAQKLIDGRPYRLGKQKKPFIDGSMPTAEALQVMLAGIAVRIVKVQAAMLDIRAPEGIKQMRVALRRFRSIERTFRNAVKGRTLYKLARRARAYGKALGPARDLDVFVDETMTDVFFEPSQAKQGLAALGDKAGTMRAEAWADAHGLIRSRDFIHFTIDLMEAAILAPWRERLSAHGAGGALQDFAPGALDKARRKVLETEAAMDKAVLAARHPLRIKIKKLRYAAQMLAPLYDHDRRKAYMGSLTALQDALGEVNDAVVASTLADETRQGSSPAGIRAAGFVSGYKAAEAEAALEYIDLAWRDFASSVPFWHEE